MKLLFAGTPGVLVGRKNNMIGKATRIWIVVPALWLAIALGPVPGDGAQACGLCQLVVSGTKTRTDGEVASVTLVVKGMMKSRSGAT